MRLLGIRLIRITWEIAKTGGRRPRLGAKPFISALAVAFHPAIFRKCSHTFGTFCPEVRHGTGDGGFHIRPTLCCAKSCAKGCPFDVPIERSVVLSTQKTDYRQEADSPSFVVIFRLPTAQPEYSSIIPYWGQPSGKTLFLCYSASVGGSDAASASA